MSPAPVPRRRNDPEMDNYIYMGGRKPKSADRQTQPGTEPGEPVITRPVPKRRNDPEMDNYIYMGGRKPQGAEGKASKRSGAAEANRSKSPKER